MLTKRTVKVLYILRLLEEGCYSKDDLIAKFSDAKLGETNKYLVTSYIKTLIKCGFKIKTKKEGNKNYYSLKHASFKLKFSEEEIELLEKIKEIVISKKSIEKIKTLMYLFYRLALVIENDDFKNILIDFDYYSYINWYLVKQLEKHCKNKDIILIDYAHKDKPQGLKLQVHADSLNINEWSDKIYLCAELFTNGEFSHLPVDRILAVDKVIEKNVPFKIPVNKITYKISRNLYDEIELDKEESLTELTKDYAVIERNQNNKFYIVQRLLSFCPELYYISDNKIKEEVTEKLKTLRKNYEE